MLFFYWWLGRNTCDRNRDLHSWSFYDLQVKLTYKAQARQSQVLMVSAKYTSQRCPKCGQICKENRNHVLHRYDCAYCGFRTNDDRIGAMNLYELGKQYLAGNEHSKFELNNVADWYVGNQGRCQPSIRSLICEEARQCVTTSEPLGSWATSHRFLIGGVLMNMLVQVHSQLSKTDSYSFDKLQQCKQ